MEEHKEVSPTIFALFLRLPTSEKKEWPSKSGGLFVA
jgi:hypothetical protein